MLAARELSSIESLTRHGGGERVVDAHRVWRGLRKAVSQAMLAKGDPEAEEAEADEDIKIKQKYIE